MRALVMSAGLGTRLRPLTDRTPKPLVLVKGRPMVEHVLESLGRCGVGEALLNIHYLPEKMRAFVEDWNGRGKFPHLHIQDESREILGSGGAVAQAGHWLFQKHGTALVCNSDVLAEPDLHAFALFHGLLAAKGAECTLALMRHPEAGTKYNGLRREGDLVVGFEMSAQPGAELWHFPGYYLLEKRALERMPAPGAPFSVVEKLWQPLAAEKRLGGWEYKGPYHDLGTVEDLRRAEKKGARA